MADSDLVAPQKQSFYVGDVNYKTGLSEALFRKIGSAINYANKAGLSKYVLGMGGYFRPNSLDVYTFPSIFIKDVTTISYYTMSTSFSGTAGTSSINFKVINATGTELGVLFSTPPSITEASLTNAMVGYDVKNVTEIRKVTTTGYNNGVVDPSYLTLPVGYELKMYVTSNSTDALNLSVNLGMESQS